jgi:8-oxo-dGTP pyrophosphatase MutT (NUDIX family)
VQSKSGKRWVLPKGHIERGQTAAEAGLQEAWEEAGLLGALHQEPVGSYFHEKHGQKRHIVVFLMHVTEVSADWPESHRRPRRWVPPEEAIQRMANPGLRKLLRVFWSTEQFATRLEEASITRSPIRSLNSSPG